MEQLLRDGTNKRTRDVLGTVALSAVAVVVGGMPVAGYVWVGRWRNICQCANAGFQKKVLRLTPSVFARRRRHSRANLDERTPLNPVPEEERDL